jgi:glycosyltransferase involved in cell wall biosynthesis
VIVDTGDLGYALAVSTGSRSFLGTQLIRFGEWAAIRVASHVVIRGREHARFLPDVPLTHIPDLPPEPLPFLRSGGREKRPTGLEDPDLFTVGVLGSIVFARRLGISYGWDLIEALPATPEHVRALIVGDGDGLQQLKARATQLGVTDRCRFPGWVEESSLAEWLAVMDAGLSTQSNDPVGMVRTTAKLPVYLSAGIPVLASDVGEARRILGPLGWTIPYRGTVDRDYPARLAAAITRWALDPEAHEARRREAHELARAHFDPAQARERLAHLLDEELQLLPGR